MMHGTTNIKCSWNLASSN